MNTGNLDKDYFTIKEFADFVGITTSALRHYDKTGVFVPAKRSANGRHEYRCYSPMQITTVKVIRVLAEIGVPLDIIKDLMVERTPEKMLKLLSKQKGRIADELRFIQDIYSVISTFTDLLAESMCVTENEISIAEMPEKSIILGDINDFTGDISFMREFTHFCSAMHEPKLNMSFPIGGYFESMTQFINEPSRPPRFFSLDPSGHEKKAEGLYLIGYARGNYGHTDKLPRQMESFAKENGLVFSGPVYSLYLTDEISVTNPEQYLLQVSASIKETRRIHTNHPPRRY